MVSYRANFWIHFSEKQARESFVDFLRGLIECDPRKRWSPQQVIIFSVSAFLTHIGHRNQIDAFADVYMTLFPFKLHL